MSENLSRLTLARAAIRPAMKGRMMIAGPAGGGKTYSALVVAEMLVGPDGRILHIDTEKESSLTYADVFRFDHLRWNAPYDPTALAITIRDAADTYDCIIIDSFSHFWRKRGGVLDIAAGKFTGWKAARPIQEDVIEAILDADAHMILCARSKMEHVQEQNLQTGKIEVRKVGMKPQQDDDLEYEVNISLEVDMDHVLHVSKSRTNAVPVGAQFIAGRAGDFATAYRDWLAGGEPVATKEDADRLVEILNGIEDESERIKAKRSFLDMFGRPEFLLVSRLKEAQKWVADRVLGDEGPPDRAEDEVPPEDRLTGVGVQSRTGEITASTSDPTATGGNGREDPLHGRESVEEPEGAEPAPATPEAAQERVAAPVGVEEQPVPNGKAAEAATVVAGLSINKVMAQLAGYGIEMAASPAGMRQQLIDALVARVVCDECGGIQQGPHRKGEKMCGCPF